MEEMLVDIFIDPPPCNVDSDEDSADEDSGGKIDNLSGRHLLSGASAILRSGKRLGGPEEDISEDPKTEVSNNGRMRIFKRSIAQYYCRKFGVPPSGSGIFGPLRSSSIDSRVPDGWMVMATLYSLLGSTK